MPTLTDARYDALRVLVPSAPPHINDMLFAWTLTQGGTGLTLNDRIYSMLIAQGAAPGQVNDMWAEVLTLEGFTGSLNDQMTSFFVAGGSFGPPGPPNTWEREESTDSWGTESGGAWLTEG